MSPFQVAEVTEEDVERGGECSVMQRNLTMPYCNDLS